jgi:hypothetical protein
MTLPILRRDLLHQALNGNVELISAFEQLWEAAETLIRQMEAVTGSTSSIQDAGVITTSLTDAFPGSRVLAAGDGIDIADDGTTLTLEADATVPKVEGGHPARLIATAPTHLVLPTLGTLATTGGEETLTGKTMVAPKFAGLTDYADDTAAAAGGVPVGGSYRTGSALKVRAA